MNKQQLRNLIQHSAVLTEEERAYWLEHFEKLNNEQCSELEKILTDGEKDLEAGLQGIFKILGPAIQSAFNGMSKLPS